MKPSTKAAVALGAVLTGVVATAVWMGGLGSSDDLAIHLEGSDPTIAVLNGSEGDSMGASLTTRLVYLPQDRCVALARPQYNGPAVLDASSLSSAEMTELANELMGAVWPAGTKAAKGNSTAGVTLPGGETLWAGDSLSAGAASTNRSELRNFPSRLADRCVGQGGIQVLTSVTKADPISDEARP